MQFYAIKHLPTGGFLPAREGRGHTHSEPEVGSVPRLFPTARSAKGALVHWLRGHLVVKRGHDSFTGESYEGYYIEPVPSRVASEMAVVTINLKEVP
jgi:hypothetical protein